MRRSEFCKHYRAMSTHASCNAGVNYDVFKGVPFNQRPCFERDGVAPSGCELAVFPTVEERAAAELEDQRHMENYTKARQTIVDHLGGPWKKGVMGTSGNILCPVCEKGRLDYSRSGYNGHIHAKCSTADCVSWME